jgi:uncharacterized membrane protein YeaQ/YmgE (transglycosylase-associated protein family)
MDHGIIYTCLIGIAVGLVAKLLMPGRQPGGIFGTLAAGLAGAWLARWASERFGIYLPLGEWSGFASSVVGAIVILLLWRMLARSRA